MSIIIDGKEIKDFLFDGTALEKIIFNGTTVWEKEIIEVIMRIKSLLGNQKMNMTKDTITSFCNALQSVTTIPADKADVVLFPQTCLIDRAAQILSGTSIKVGAQLCSPAASGAYTGQNSVAALYSCGARFFYINNYEVLSYLGGMDLNYVEQVKRVLEQSNDTVAVVEVADNLEEHEAGYDAIESRFGEMFSNLNMAVNVQQMITGNRLRFAYAPVWAIGTGKTCSPAQADAYMQILRNIIKSDNTEVAQSAIIYYAGTVNPNTFSAFLAQPDIDGGVAGGAALNPNNFATLISQLLSAAGA